MRRINVGARLVICGTAAIASWELPPQGPRVERHLLVKCARMQGFLIFHYAQRYSEARRELESWVRAGVFDRPSQLVLAGDVTHRLRRDQGPDETETAGAEGVSGSSVRDRAGMVLRH